MMAVHLRKAPAATRNASAWSARLPAGRPAADGVVRREAACACGGGCPRCIAGSGAADSPRIPRAKPLIGRVDDPLEHEADRIADRVMRADEPEPAAGASTPRARHSAAQDAAPAEAPDLVRQSLATPGTPLDAATRALFEPRFGRDFSAVRIHADDLAAEASRSIHARAFTLGSHIAFADGQYDPAGPAGRALLAHELAHVTQQSGGGRIVQRDIFDDAKKAIEQKAEQVATEQLIALGNEPLGPPSGFTGPSHCPATFCQPFVDTTTAYANLAWAGPLILAGIAKKVNARVVPLWATHMAGGSAPQNLTANFGADFSASPTTEQTTRFLVAALRQDVEANRATLTSGGSPITIDFTPRLGTALAAIDDPKEATR